MKRRDFLRAGTGAGVAAAAATGSAAAAEGGGGGGGGTKPDFGSWIADVDGGYKDARGSDSVTVKVGASGNGGNYAFDPSGLWVDEGTTVTWEWTGQGGGHNVHAMKNADYSSPTASEAGHTFEHTFDSGGQIVEYECQPHASLGMKGSVAVGDGVPTVSTGGGGGGELDPETMGVPFQAHYVGISTVLMVLVSLVYTFFVLKYGESPHASAPNKGD
ncbi:MAG: halocyanin domain-containing protein [Halobacteriaceae archaeon]